jgi:septum formation protein
MRIILGSQSPRRKKVLNDAGYVIEVLPANFDEESIRHAEPAQLTQLLAAAKNRVLQERVSGSPCIITADTVVTHAGRIYEKAQTEREAYEWITSFMGSTISIHTSHVVHDMHTGYEAQHTAVASVSFSEIPPDVRAQLALNAYEASVAGGFHMSDPLLRPYVTIHGDEPTILGLDINWVRETLTHIEKLHMREHVRALYTQHNLQHYAAEAARFVAAQELFMHAQRVYAYHPISTLEIPFVDALMSAHPEKQWVFPETQGDTMHFPGAEEGKAAVCMLVPALALSASGQRLGKGKGFYDRYLESHPTCAAASISVVPDFAFFAALPVSAHDVPVRIVHTVAAS